MTKDEVKHKALKLFDKLLDELFPENLSCLCCDEELNSNEYLCKECLKGLVKIENSCEKCGERVNSFDKYCKNCKANKRSFDKSVACFEFDKTAKNLIYKLKYNGAKYVASTFSKYLFEAFINAGFKSIDIVCCTPLNIKRLKQRGYNQAQVLAQKFCEEASKSGIKLNANFELLKRVKDTPTQTHLTREERKLNLSNAFELNVDKSEVKGKTILVVDDIFTTGATIDEISKVLKKAGAKRVYCLTVCHTVLEKI